MNNNRVKDPLSLNICYNEGKNLISVSSLELISNLIHTPLLLYIRVQIPNIARTAVSA